MLDKSADRSLPVATRERPHSFHIAVMGTGYTIDTPVKVARYGITSVISLVDDALVELIRKRYCDISGETYQEIPESDDNARALRITSYLNLLNQIITKQVSELRASPFEQGSEITRYFELLPESKDKDLYRKMLSADDQAEKAAIQEKLRQAVEPGLIEANIMTKMDRDYYRGREKLPAEFADAMAALRGFGESEIDGALVFSAGINPRLYGYIAEFPDFFPDESCYIRKRVILKVSDFRSAMVQGKFLAKRGIWVSEYRVEAGLNCGGHAFPTGGRLVGMTLKDFKEKRVELAEKLHPIFRKALEKAGRVCPESPCYTRLTVQGGIGSAAENKLMLDEFGVDGTGWATPFLLVPEVTCVDDLHLKLLAEASENEVSLSECSPMGVPYWNLSSSLSEDARRERISSGRPGSPCPKRYGAINMEFTDLPVCVSARGYVQRKLKHIDASQELTTVQKEYLKATTISKACICHDLAGGATLKYGMDSEATPAICPGPNIIWFSKIASLEEMVDHIYGRSQLPLSSERPHMFASEIEFNIKYLSGEVKKLSEDNIYYPVPDFENFRSNLRVSIDFVESLSKLLEKDAAAKLKVRLSELRESLEAIAIDPISKS
jgi:hypothetical protein